MVNNSHSGRMTKAQPFLQISGGKGIELFCDGNGSTVDGQLVVQGGITYLLLLERGQGVEGER